MISFPRFLSLQIRTGALLLAFASLVFVTGSANAIPRFSLLTGTRCSACHMNPQGSGLRTDLGWSMMNETGLFKWSQPSPDDTTVPTNMIMSGHAIIGTDARLQYARSSAGKRILIPMQLTASVAYLPAEELSIYSNINLASIEERARGGNLFPGQTDLDGAIQYQPSVKMPSLRVGMLQPSIGIRQDDHTVYVRREAGLNGTYLMPAYYNDLGAEITYEGMKWLTVNAGLYNAYFFQQIDPSIGTVSSMTDFSKPTLSGRVMLWPQLLEEGINTEIGASYLVNGSFRMINAFAGLGLADKATVYIEGMYSNNADERRIRNFTVTGSYKLFDWLSTHWRYDWGQTELYPSVDLGWAQMFTFGFEFFPLPYVELRPEFRASQKNPYSTVGSYSAQYTVQLHMFY